MNRPDFSDGLIPAVIQDSTTGAVLMLAYMNEMAWDHTLDSGFVLFWSRSRDDLWKKGETSGNTLRMTGWSVDCDRDTVLIQADPAGPACHTGSITCFEGAPAGPAAVLSRLEIVIAQRSADRPAGSYTTTLLDGGPEATGRKVVEEATEVLLAAKDHAAGAADDQRLAEEAADLIYHLLVALAERGLRFEDVTNVLVERAR